MKLLPNVFRTENNMRCSSVDYMNTRTAFGREEDSAHSYYYILDSTLDNDVAILEMD
ncbi:hypothetical protein Ocin01_14483 [Orchesella cincta]|uniref:Uncharacterized protein n=1 Tax=Orchesella cincta TaxID=48709 RepID=A0A1D2MGT8_ORCCI|nr:hypothetical protein Ocin01_14483 [Orchesella cincta]